MKKQMFLKLAPIGFCLLASGQDVFAHTRLTVAKVLEGADKIYNNIGIGHGCGENPVIANSFAFPDETGIVYANNLATGLDPINIATTGAPVITRIPSRDVFAFGQLSLGDPALNGKTPTEASNPVGSQSWYNSTVSTDPVQNAINGNGVPPHGNKGLVPIQISGVIIDPKSCAKSIKYEVAVMDVCIPTPLNSVIPGSTANGWIPASGGNNWLATSKEDPAPSPATYTVTRDPKNKIPRKNGDGTLCKKGIDYVVKPTQTQLNRDLPIASPDGLVPAFSALQLTQ
jgi:hypothetical protein